MPSIEICFLIIHVFLREGLLLPIRFLCLNATFSSFFLKKVIYLNQFINYWVKLPFLPDREHL